MNNHKKSYAINIIKVVSLCLAFVIVGISFVFYSNWKYNNSLNKLYNEFNNKNYEIAYKIYSDDLKNISFKDDKLNNDLSKYFTNIVSTVCDALYNESISKTDALELLNEINKYGLFNDSLQKLAYSIQGKDTRFIASNDELFKIANDYFIKEDYSQAIEYLNHITPDYLNMKAVNNLKNECKEKYKLNLLKESDILAANKYYTKAINLLNNADENLISSNDEDILKKLNFYEMIKEEYLKYAYEEDTEYTSTAILDTITPQNINTLDIESKTSNIIYVSLNDQKTYIYEGSKNNWNLLKTFPCSTGLPGKETPKGVFDIDGRGEWFFSEQFNQGGKYYVQFLGDYLFHSVPYDRDASNIVDSTLGKPASHGCIRLKTQDSKWIYDNIKNDTKVIIN